MTAERDAVAVAVSTALKHSDASRVGRTKNSHQGSVTAFALSMGLIAAAPAQDQAAARDDSLEEITVTGSRIVAPGFGRDQPYGHRRLGAFEHSSTVALEASLNKLPQFVPAVTQFVTTDVQNTATNTVGASTVNLRGLGPNRNLVLLDGRRAMPVNASLVVDINSIPSAAIKRVEIISGGASSAYGADAVGGVVNFILKNDFEGMEFDTQYGITEYGDDQELRISGLMGGNFSDNRGNAMFGVEYFKRGDARQDERDFYTKRLGGSERARHGASSSRHGYVAGRATAEPGCRQRHLQPAPAGPGVVRQRRHSFFVNKDGTLYTGPGGSRMACTATTAFSTTVPQGLQARHARPEPARFARVDPAERYSLFGRADYDVNDNCRSSFRATSQRRARARCCSSRPRWHGGR